MSLTSSNLICYLGKDLPFFEQLKSELKVEKSSLRFMQVTEDKTLELVENVLTEMPRILLIDFSMPLRDILRLVFNLKAELKVANVSLVALFNGLENRLILKTALSLGIPTALIKELGAKELTASLLDLLEPKRVLLHMKAGEWNLEAQSFLRLGFVAEKYLHLESSWRFKPGEEVHLQTHLSEKLKLPMIFKILRTGDHNIYSSAKFWQDVEPVHYNDAQLKALARRLKTYEDLLKKTPRNKTLQYEVSFLKNEIDALVSQSCELELSHEERVQNWMRDNKELSRPKRTRIMVIDPKLRFLSEEKQVLDSFPYSLRCYSRVYENEGMIHRNLPGIIAYEMGSEEELFKDLKLIQELCSKERDYHPLVVIFNCSKSVTEIKARVSELSLLTHQKHLDLKTIHLLAQNYEKTEGRLLTHGMSYGDQEKRLYLSKYDEGSSVEFVMEFKVREIGERAIRFTTSRPVPQFSTFYIKYPFKMSLTVFRCEGLGEDESLGLIHGIGMNEKKQLLSFLENL